MKIDIKTEIRTTGKGSVYTEWIFSGDKGLLVNRVYDETNKKKQKLITLDKSELKKLNALITAILA
jgi:hypothetical protein